MSAFHSITILSLLPMNDILTNPSSSPSSFISVRKDNLSLFFSTLLNKHELCMIDVMSKSECESDSDSKAVVVVIVIVRGIIQSTTD